MNEELLLDFLEEFEKISIPLIAFRVKEIHIAKDRIMDNPPEMYNAPLIDNQTRYKGRTKAFEINNGTSPSVAIASFIESFRTVVTAVNLFRIIICSCHLNNLLLIVY